MGIAMKKRFVIVQFILLVFLLPCAVYLEEIHASNPIIIQNIRYHNYPTHTRIVIDASHPLRYLIDSSPDARSLSIHLYNAIFSKTLQAKPILLFGGETLQKIELREEGIRGIYLLLTFNRSWEYNAMILTNPDRLVLDITDIQNTQETVAAPAPVIPGIPLLPPPVETPDNIQTPIVPTQPITPLLPSPSAPPASRKIQTPVMPALPVISSPPVTPLPLSGIHLIVIDPGHGGDAPGAIGPTGLTESEVVLDVSLMVKKRIEERLNKKVLLTRDRDTSVALHDRTKMANDQKADLFVSIHANASPKRNVQGIETYLFGRATSESALATAARENATNLQTTQTFQDVILSDLLRDFTLNESLELAHYTQESFVKTILPQYDTKSLGVKKAPFYVLAHTKMPAILAEISFISNRIEEDRLRQNSYREKIAESIFQGIAAYIEEKR